MTNQTLLPTIEEVLASFREGGTLCIEHLRSEHPQWILSLSTWSARSGGRNHVHIRMEELAHALAIHTADGEQVDPIEMAAFLYYGLYFSLIDLLRFFQANDIGYRQFSSIKSHFTRCFGWQLRDRYNNTSPLLVQKFNRRGHAQDIPERIDLPERILPLRDLMIPDTSVLAHGFDITGYNTLTSRARKIRVLLVALGCVATIGEADAYITSLYRGQVASAGDILGILRWVVVEMRRSYHDMDASIVSMSVGHFHSTFLYARKRKSQHGQGRRGRPKSIIRS